MARRWLYDLTIHSAAEVTDIYSKEQTREIQPRVISCDAQGHCFYDDVLRPNMQPFLRLLNNKGSEGWELVQYSFHGGNLYLLWKKEADEQAAGDGI